MNRLRDPDFSPKFLQCDPTAGYGCLVAPDVASCAGYAGKITPAINNDPANAYSTYKREGLPPGPIANPGKAALEAAANPADTNDLYFVADGTGGHAFAETLDQHLKNVDHWRQIERDAKEAKDRVAPDLLPIMPASAQPGPRPKKSELDVSPKVFGALVPRITTKPAPASLASRLARIGAERQSRLALLGPNGPLSAVATGKNLADSGLVVEGVNDATPGDPTAAAPAQTYPLSPQMLAEQRSREARYGEAAPPPGKMANAETNSALLSKPAANGRPRIIDASEGTALDPLLNTTYDLNYPKVVPPLRLQ